MSLIKLFQVQPKHSSGSTTDRSSMCAALRFLDIALGPPQSMRTHDMRKIYIDCSPSDSAETPAEPNEGLVNLVKRTCALSAG